MKFLMVLWELIFFYQERFSHDNINVYTNARVKEVQSDKILFDQKGDDGILVTKQLPMGFCLWSTGVCESPMRY
jgi:NADH dehydrogenase